jgi:hypothetical protein
MSADQEANGSDNEWDEGITRQVLESGGIQRIVCVDDIFTDTGNVDRDTIVAAVATGNVSPDSIREIAREALGEESDTYLVDDGDFAGQAQWLREHGRDMSEALWSRLGEAAPENRDDAITAQDPETLQQLRAFADAIGLEFVPLNLNSWRKQSSEILSRDGCTLIFFDRNLSGDGGADTEGEALLTATVRAYPPEKVIAVLFTHSVRVDGEYERWLAIASDPTLMDRVLVIAKERIRTDRAAFASELKMAILAPRLRRVADRVKSGFAEKASEAAGQIGRLTPHLLHSVLVSAVEREGSWGPDGLVGIASSYLRRWVEAYVRADAAVWADATQLRELSLRSRIVVLPGAEADEYNRINRVLLFDEPEHVNDLRLPIDTGDIFAFFDPNRPLTGQEPSALWVLVLQRCDLAVRSGGRRSYDPPLMPLAHIVRPTERTFSSGAAAIGRILLSSSPVLNHSASEVNLMDRRFAPSVALDACALNRDGIARLNVGEELTTDGLIPAWVDLAKRHLAWAEHKLDIYEQLRGKLGKKPDRQIEMALSSALTGTSREVAGFTCKVDVEHKVMLFGVRRVARLREPHSQDLMERLGALSSRIPLTAALDPR